MSFVVLAIGAAHALPPILGATMWKTKRGVWIGVAIAVLIGLASGNPAFVVMDLIGAALGAWIGLSILRADGASTYSQGRRIPQTSPASVAQGPKAMQSTTAGTSEARPIGIIRRTLYWTLLVALGLVFFVFVTWLAGNFDAAFKEKGGLIVLGFYLLQPMGWLINQLYPSFEAAFKRFCCIAFVVLLGLLLCVAVLKFAGTPTPDRFDTFEFFFAAAFLIALMAWMVRRMRRKTAHRGGG